MRFLLVLRVASGILLIVGLVLGIMTMRAMNDMRRWLGAVNNALVSHSLADRALQLDLLNARAGLLRNYDPVNADLASERKSLADLGRQPMGPRARQLLGILVEKAAQREGLVERFKSDNALLQNSLARFTANVGGDVGIHNVLSARILKLTLDTSTQTVREARAALNRMPSARDGTPAAQLVSHARLLVTILPEIDELLHSIRAMRIESRLDEMDAVLSREYEDRSARLLHLQVSLAAVIILLIATVIALVLVQRLRTREWKAQAANARLSAAIATPLIDSGHATFASRVQDAVRRLAQHVGARRLQLMTPGVATRAYFLWPESESNPQWLREMTDAAEADGAWIDDKVIASRNGGNVPPALDAAMRDAGIGDLVLLRTAEPFRVVIGFEPQELAFAQRRDHMAGVASAIVAIAHGARREMMQLERDRLKRVLARARRMETIGAMASGVAHNFNNIIGAIGGFAEIGQERTRNGSLARYSFDEIQCAVDRARELVADILNFAKQGRSAKLPINLFDVLTHSVRLMTASARDEDAFQLEASDRRYPLIGSDRDLQQVLLNICNNASQASGRRPVHIFAHRQRLVEMGHMSHGNLDPGRYVVISITDSGPGIPVAARRRLFEPFFTTKAGGTGLGLSTAWEIVQDHGGTIDVENIAGGARFAVWLPEATDAAVSPVSGKGARILLVAESDQLAAEEDLLAELGYEPLGFTFPADVDALREVIGNCDAVLLASGRSPPTDALVRAIGPVLQDRPLLLALPELHLAGCAVPFHRIDYPIRPEELTDLLTRTGAASHLVGAS